MNKKMGSSARQGQYQEKYKRKFSIKWFKYCKDPLEEIEGWYEMLKDTSGKRWHIHHRDEIPSNGVVVSSGELKSRGVYWNLPASKLIFMTESEHRSLHHSGELNSNWGKPLSDEHKNKIGKANSGKHHSEETKKKFRGRTGEKNPMSKPIEVYGVPYVSKNAAKDALEIGNRKIYLLIKEGEARYI